MAKQLWQQTGVLLITKLRRTMKNPLLKLNDRLLLRSLLLRQKEVK
ncbi:MAG: hypothetical protein EBV05_10780 [Cyanobacteria bacterium WB6_1B_304]|nr:hypothetical protein [Cyanobacteria bacterium WB6_1B_304]